MTDIIQKHPLNIGNGFRAYSIRGGQHAEPIDPFLGVDHARMSGPTFPPHPHAGFSAVSYLFEDSETGMQNRDSLGTRNLIKPGGLHWTAAGKGIVHEEEPAVTGKTVHMLQIFVNLITDKQKDAPFALSLEPEQVPVIKEPGVSIRVPLGCYGDVCSPLITPTKVNLYDIDLKAGAEVAVQISARNSAFVLPIVGAIEIDGDVFDPEKTALPVYPAQESSSEIVIKASQGPAKIVVLSGEPLRQQVFWKGSLALASEQALLNSVAAYQRGEFGKLE